MSWRWLRWRAGLLVLVMFATLVAFSAGVLTTERPGLAEAGIFAHVYYAGGLFVFGGMDLGLPKGGPDWARALLWMAYFAAPAITATAVIEGIFHAMNPRRWRASRLRNHIVLVGAGRLALLYLARLRVENPSASVLLVDTARDKASVSTARDAFGAQLIVGDIANPEILQRLNLASARRVLLLTGDDYLNLDVASKIATQEPRLMDRLVVHVSDLRMLRAIALTSVLALTERFNIYQVAASHLVESRMVTYFERTPGKDVVILAGFGRFGQTFLERLQRTSKGQMELVVLVDVAAQRQCLEFEEHVGFEDYYERAIVEGDIRDPRTWQQIDLAIEGRQVHPVFVVGTGDDDKNVMTALRLSSRYSSAYVIARAFRVSDFTAELAANSRFEVVAVADLVRDSMPRRWFV